MKKILCTLMVLMLAWVASDALAQKTVTYTFKGRAKGFLLPEKPLDIVPSGDVPAGVRVSSFFITEDDGSSVDNERIQDVEMDGFAGSALLTEYVVEPQTTAHVLFDGFRYEIAGVKWNRCSEIAVLTSKGETWVTSWNNATIGSWTFDTTGEEGYSTGGELFYHTRNFLADDAYPFTGLRSLNIDCTSRLPQHGIAVKDFKISYYEPVITIADKDTEMNIDDVSTITAYIDPATGHPGAFTNAEIIYEIKGNETGIVEVSKGAQISAEGATKGAYPYTLTGKKNGSVTVIAKIVYGGQVVSQTSYKLKVGKVEWDVYRDEGNVYSYGGSNANSLTGSQITNTTYYSQLGITGDQIANISKPESNNNFRVGLQKINYTQFLPPYSSVNTQFKNVSGRMETSGNASFKIELIKLAHGADAQDADITYNTVDNNETNTSTKVLSVVGKDGTSAFDKSSPRTFSGKTITYNNINNATSSSDLENKEQLVMIATYRSTTGGQNRTVNSCQVSIPKSDYSATYTYYAYITYNGNGANGGSTGSAITGDNLTNGLYNVSGDDVNRLGMKATAPTNTESVTGTNERKGNTTTTVNLDANGFTRLNDNGCDYVFMGWNTDKAQADAGVVEYADGASFCPYDSETEGGKGPVTLYAVWNKIPAPGDLDDPDVDYLIYAVFANGGTFAGDKERIEGVFVTGQAVSIPFTTLSRTGYTLQGYYDAPEGGVQLFNASGAIQNNANTQKEYFTPAANNWKATSDVFIYAQWKANTTGTLPPTPQTITFNLNGGDKFANDNTGTETKQVTKGESTNNNVSDLTPVRAGHKFIGWYTADTGGEMAYNANGESVELESISKDPATGTTYNYRAVNSKFFGTNLKFKGTESPFDNSSINLYAQWMLATTKIAFHEGTTSANSAAYNANASTAITAPESEAGKMQTPSYAETEYDEVILTRALKDDKWNTICFPCFISKEQTALLFKTVKQYKELDCSASDATMKFKTCDAIIPGVPYFVKLKDSYPTADNGKAWIATNGDLKDIHVKTSDVIKHPTSLTYSSNGVTVSMVGEFNTHLHIKSGAFYLQNDKFYESGANYDGKEVWGNNKGFRCYFTQEGSYAGAKMLNMHIDLEGYDGWTGDGIEEVEMDEVVDASSAMYDISGRRLTHAPRKGIYIMNGKKFIVK